MLDEVRWCGRTIQKNFNMPLKMTNEDEQNLKNLLNVIFVIKNLLMKM